MLNLLPDSCLQESRHILIAEYQNIIVSELLPLILGTQAAEKVKEKTTYDSRVRLYHKWSTP